MLGGDIADQLHDDDGLADAGTPEQADLAALGEGGHQVDDLDAGFQHLGVGRLLADRRRGTVDGQSDVGLDLALLQGAGRVQRLVGERLGNHG